ncbi:hypothetical protein PMAYCL1PPCAC_20811, partial [Pristionchus mayeri]
VSLKICKCMGPATETQALHNSRSRGMPPSVRLWTSILHGGSLQKMQYCELHYHPQKYCDSSVCIV